MASFLGMWVVMTVVMMLPVAAPMLWRYRQAVAGGSGTRFGLLTAIVGVAYFSVWSILGVAAFPLSVALGSTVMDHSAMTHVAPIAAGALVSIAGAYQFTRWKARHLACCRHSSGHDRRLTADAGTAWRHGVRLGLQCARCCANLMVIPFVIGIMDLRAMFVLGTAVAVERLTPVGDHVARAIGVVFVGAGLMLLARAAALA